MLGLSSNLPVMQFQINTLQSVGAQIAKEESRKASKRKSTDASEPSIKRQKLSDGSSTLAPAPAHSHNHATTSSRSTDGAPKLDASLPHAHTQAYNTANLGPAGAASRKRKPDVGSIQITQELELDSDYSHQVQAQDDNLTSLEPASKKQKLSDGSSTLAPASSHSHNQATTSSRSTDGIPKLDAFLPQRVSYENSIRANTPTDRQRPDSWCRPNGLNPQPLDGIPNVSLMSPSFDPYQYMPARSSADQSKSYEALKNGVHTFDGLPVKEEMSNNPIVDPHHLPRRNIHDPSTGPPALDPAIQAHLDSNEASSHNIPIQGSVSKERREFGLYYSVQNTAAKMSPYVRGSFEAACPSMGTQTSTSSSSVNSKFHDPICDSSHHGVGHNTSGASSTRSSSACPDHLIIDDTPDPSSNRSYSLSLDRSIGHGSAAAGSDQMAPPHPESNLGDSTTPVSSRASSVSEVRNRGGRPRGRKARAPRRLKTPKGPARFQQNHPVRAAVNVDVWENILRFCPPDFLLKARKVCSTFRSMLKDDSHIWKISRVDYFGPDMPEPPAGLTEPQYADLLTGTGCQTRGCESKKTRKTYWAFQKRLCMECFQRAFISPKALRDVYQQFEMSETAQYRSIALYYRHMEDFLPAMKFDRWNNYQWLGDYDPTPSWGQLYRSGQYVAFSASAFAAFSSELADFVGNEYDVEHRRLSSQKPMPGKTCPSQDAIDEWFDMKRAINDAILPKLQAVENWCETYKRNNQKEAKDIRKNREMYYEEQAASAGLDKSLLKNCASYKAAIAISKPATMQSWKILLPKLRAEYNAAKEKIEREAEKEFVSNLELEMETEWTGGEWNDDYGYGFSPRME